MPHVEASTPLAGVTRAVTQREADPLRAGERAPSESVFDMLGIHVARDCAAAAIHHGGRPPATATVAPTDGGVDASMY
jgi:hypothetical protein